MGTLKAKVKMFGDKMFVIHNKSAIQEAGIILADTVDQTKMKNDFTVVAVSEGTYQPDGTIRPLPYKVGDRVQLTQYGGEVELYTGEKVSVISSVNVLCRIDEDLVVN